jgi:hypothetical protein
MVDLQASLENWFSQDDFLTQLAIPFSATAGSQEWLDNASALKQSILNGTYSIRLEVRTSAELEGAMGAYSATGTTGNSTIYRFSRTLGRREIGMVRKDIL